MNTKIKIFLLLLIITVSMLFTCCGHYVENIFEPKYIEIGGQKIQKDTAEINLSGAGINAIQPLDGLEYLERLDIRNNPIAAEQIMSFKLTNPNCQVLWSITIDNTAYESTTEVIDFSGSGKLSISELLTNFGYFDNLSEVRLTNMQIGSDEYKNLKNTYPNTNFLLDVSVCGLWFNEYTAAINLSECGDINQAELLESLSYFNSLEMVELYDALGDAVLDEKLLADFPQTVFRWNAKLGDNVYLSDVKEINYAEITVEDLDEFKEQISYFPYLEYIDMCYSGLSNQQMEQLIELYPAVQFVWMVRVGSWEMRTDVKAFCTSYSRKFEGGAKVGEQYMLDNKGAQNLKYCTDLEVLDIGHQRLIEDWEFLSHMPKMKHLIVGLTLFSDMSLISHMEDLEYLEIFNTKVSDLSPAVQLKSLKYFNASDILVTSVDYLTEMDHLEWLWFCSQEFVSEEELIRLSEALSTCRVETEAPGSTRWGWRSYDNVGYIAMREALDMEPMFWSSDPPLD